MKFFGYVLRLNPVVLTVSSLIAPASLATPASAMTPQANVIEIAEAGNLQDSPSRQASLVPSKIVRLAQATSAGDTTITATPQSAATAPTNPSLNQPASPANTMAQVTSVSQLSDVRPTDWAFQALQSLVERYGCIEGYPDKTFRGNRAATRYELAAALNACLNQLSAQLGGLTSEDLATIKRLQDEFAGELATLRGRVDALDAQTAELEANQFSTTTKLVGEAIFFLGGAFGNEAADQDDDPDNNPDLEENVILGNRVRLNFDTSFTGEDRLRVRLQARNITPFDEDVTGTRMTRLSIDGDEDNVFNIDYIYYRFAAGEQTTVTVSGYNAEFSDIIYTINPLLEASGSGSISRFGRYSPIYRGSGAGATVVHEFNDNFNLTLGYLAPDAESPVESNGLFGGNYNALAQLVYSPGEDIDIGLVYAHSYFGEDSDSGVNLAFSTGSANARNPFGSVSTSTDSLQLGTSIGLSPQVVLSGWLEYTFANSEVSDDNADIFNFAVNLAFPNLGKEGNLAAIVFGIPPKVTSNSIDANQDEDTSFHIEALYRYQLTDNIAITPGVIVITNPEHNDNNDPIYVGAIRTTFNF